MDEYFKQERVITSDGEAIGDPKLRKFYNPFQDGRGYNFKYKSEYKFVCQLFFR